MGSCLGSKSKTERNASFPSNKKRSYFVVGLLDEGVVQALSDRLTRGRGVVAHRGRALQRREAEGSREGPGRQWTASQDREASVESENPSSCLSLCSPNKIPQHLSSF